MQTDSSSELGRDGRTLTRIPININIKRPNGETEVTTTELGTFDKSRSRYIRTWYILKIQKKLQQKLVHTSNPEVSTTEVGTYCKSRTNCNRSRYILQIQN